MAQKLAQLPDEQFLQSFEIFMKMFSLNSCDCVRGVTDKGWERTIVPECSLEQILTLSHNFPQLGELPERFVLESSILCYLSM